jgi:hypothetical protein
MKRLNRLDFLGAPTPPVTGWAMAVLSAGTLAFVAAQLWSMTTDSQRLAGSLRSADMTLAAATAPAARDAVVRVQAQVRDKSAVLPWSDVLAVFDSHANGGIGLLRFEPEPGQAGRVKVSARARDQATATAFVHALEADARLRNVSLIDQVVEASGTDRSVSFTVLAGWRSDTPERMRTTGPQ